MHYKNACEYWHFVDNALLETIHALARLDANLILAPSKKYAAKKGRGSGGGSTSASSGRGKGNLYAEGGRSTPAGGGSRWSNRQFGKWAAGAAWSSSAWHGAAQALTVVNDREAEEWSIVVAQAQSAPVMWLFVAVLLIIAFLLVSVSFALSWYLSKLWYDHVEGSLRRTRRRHALAGNSWVQCNRASTDMKEIMKMTIDAIREELRQEGYPTQGCKHELAQRLLLLHRSHTDELNNLYVHPDFQ